MSAPLGNKIPKGYSQGRLQQYTPEQMNLYQSLFSNVGPESYLSKLAGGDQSTFDQMEAPAMRQFNQLQGNIASRFSGMGSGARRSSGFQNASSSAASNFAQDLASRRQQLQQNAIHELMGLSNQLLGQRPYENFLAQKPQNPWAQIAGQFGGAIPGAVAGYMTGGPAGALYGGYRGMQQAQQPQQQMNYQPQGALTLPDFMQGMY